MLCVGLFELGGTFGDLEHNLKMPRAKSDLGALRVIFVKNRWQE